MFYRKNLPTWERIARTVFGFAIIAFGVFGAPLSAISYAIIATGVTAVLTGFVGFCPMCAMVGRKLDGENS